MATQPTSYITPEEYLEVDRRAERRSEYRDGEMFEMPATGAGHCSIVFNLATQLHPQLRKRPCEAYFNLMRLKVGEAGTYSYPDAIVCNDPLFLDGEEDTILNPDAIVEVVSHSTEALDRGRKFAEYRSITSLVHYLLISAERMSVDLFTRQAGDSWLLKGATSPEATIELPAVGVRLTVADLYERVRFGKRTIIRPLQSE